MLSQNSKSMIGKMTGFEYLNVSIGTVVTILLVGFAVPFMKLPGINDILMVCYILSVICAVAALSFNFYMISFLNNTDLSKPVAETIVRVEKLNMLSAKAKLFNLILLPIFVFAAVPVGRKWVYNENIFEHLSFWAPLILVALVLGTFTIIALHRTLYTNRINTIRENLKEIEQFKNGH